MITDTPKFFTANYYHDDFIIILLHQMITYNICMIKNTHIFYCFKSSQIYHWYDLIIFLLHEIIACSFLNDYKYTQFYYYKSSQKYYWDDLIVIWFNQIITHNFLYDRKHIKFLHTNHHKLLLRWSHNYFNTINHRT